MKQDKYLIFNFEIHDGNFVLDKYVDIKPSRKTQSGFDKGPRKFPTDLNNIQINCGAKSSKANITFAITNSSSE